MPQDSVGNFLGLPIWNFLGLLIGKAIPGSCASTLRAVAHVSKVIMQSAYRRKTVHSIALYRG